MREGRGGGRGRGAEGRKGGRRSTLKAQGTDGGRKKDVPKESGNV